MHLPHLSQPSGFSIIELIIAIGVLSIIFLLVGDFLLSGFTIQRYVNEQNDAIIESRHALEIMTSELREAVPADTGSYPIETATEQEIIFYGDVDLDGGVERIRYFLDGSNLKRGQIEPSGDPIKYDEETEVVTTFSRYIENDNDPIFYYYNEDYPQDTISNPIAEPVDETAIRMIRINVLTNVDPTKVPDTRVLDTYIHIRNLKENF